MERRANFENKKRRFRRFAAGWMSLLLLSLLLTGCMGEKAAAGFSITDNSQETKAASDTEAAYTSVTDKNGWETKYNSALFDMTHSGNDVIFTYIGEGGGTDVLTIGYVENKLPSEVLYDVTKDTDPEKVERYEGFFNADSGDWCFGRYIAADSNAGTPERAYTGVEHNGGTLLISEVSTPMADEASQTACDSAVMAIRSNFKWTNHELQQEFSYIPGTYERKYEEEIEGQKIDATDTVVLNADHSGKISFQDDIDIYWTSYEIVEYESEARSEFKVEGDMLYVNLDGSWTEFAKKQ